MHLQPYLKQTLVVIYMVPLNSQLMHNFKDWISVRKLHSCYYDIETFRAKQLVVLKVKAVSNSFKTQQNVLSRIFNCNCTFSTTTKSLSLLLILDLIQQIDLVGFKLTLNLLKISKASFWKCWKTNYLLPRGLLGP